MKSEVIKEKKTPVRRGQLLKGAIMSSLAKYQCLLIAIDLYSKSETQTIGFFFQYTSFISHEIHDYMAEFKYINHHYRVMSLILDINLDFHIAKNR